MINPFLVGPRLYLRAPEVEDSAQLCAWLNHPEVRQNLARDNPLSRVAEEQFIRGLAERRDDRIFVIVLRDEDRPIGIIGLHGAGPMARHRTLGIAIGEPDCWDLGYGREAIELLLEHAFGEMDLHRVGLEVHADNPRGIACYERVGFVREGVLRDAHFRGGRFGDNIIMSVLAPEWATRRKTSDA